MFKQIIERDSGIVSLTDAMVIAPRALTNTTKIEAERLVSGILESLRRSVDDLVVHCPGVERMRMKDKGGARRVRIRFMDRFEPTVRRGDIAVPLEKFHRVS